MTRIELKGLFKVTAKGRVYWYAWRGGPRLRGEPGSAEFVASYNQAVEDRRAPDRSRFKSAVVSLQGERRTIRPSRRQLDATGARGSIASPTISAACTLRSSIARKRSGR